MTQESTFADGTLRESEFEEAIERPLIATRERVALREMLQRLAADREVAVVLDRRIDPGILLDVQIKSPAFDLGIQSLVEPMLFDVSIVGDTIYVGPESSARTLRTRIELIDRHRDEMPGMSLGRKFEVLRRHPVTWDDLTEPSEILSQISDLCGVRIGNREAIPHDLWPAGSLGYPDATEAFMLVATQFGLELEWVSPDEIRFLPEARSPTIQRHHRSTKWDVNTAAEQMTSRFPDATIVPQGRSLIVAATVEEHEQMAVLLGEKPPRRALRNESAGKLSLQRFTLRVESAPVIQLFRTLQKQGLDVRFDEQNLTSSGIDLSTKVTLNLKDATIEQLLDQACDPVGLIYRIENETISIEPKP